PESPTGRAAPGQPCWPAPSARPTPSSPAQLRSPTARPSRFDRHARRATREPACGTVPVVGLLEAILGVVAPPLCAVCGRGCGASGSLCDECAAELARLRAPAGRRPPGVDVAWAAAAY